jgi:hypothetical protein
MCPSNEARYGVKSNKALNIRLYTCWTLSGFLCSSDVSPSPQKILYAISVIFLWLVSKDKPPLGICLPLTYNAKLFKSKWRKNYGLVSIVPRKSLFLTTVNKTPIGIRPRTALSMDSDCEPLENVKDFSSTLVMYFAWPPLLSTVLWATWNVGFGRIRLTRSYASTNLK